MFLCVSFMTVKFLKLWDFVLHREVFLSHLVRVWWFQVQLFLCSGGPITLLLKHGLYLGFCDI